MKHILWLTSCVLLATSASAQMVSPSPAYQECTSLANTDPASALMKADAWLKVDSSIAAQHCRAMALYGMRRFGEAGESLSAVRDSIGRDNPSMRSYIARQAGQAFANGNQVDRAMGILGTQLDELGQTRGDNAAIAKMTSDLLLDRAKLNTAYGKLNDAAKDLDHAVSLTPLNDAVLAERAGVFEKLGDRALARADAENALKLNASNAAARDMLVRYGVIAPAPINLAAPGIAPMLAPAAGPVVINGAPEAAPVPVKKVYKRKKATAPKPSEAPAATATTPANEAP